MKNATKKRKEEYMALPKARMAFAFGPGTPDAEAGQRIKAIVRAVVEGKTGVDELADAALETEEAYYQQKRDAGGKRWTGDGNPDAPHEKRNAPHGKTDAADNNADAPHGKTDAITEPKNRTESEEPNKPNIKTRTENETETRTHGETTTADSSGSGSGGKPLGNPGSGSEASPPADFRQAESKVLQQFTQGRATTYFSVQQAPPPREEPRKYSCDFERRFLADPKNEVYNAPDALLAEYAYWYNGDPNEHEALRTYRGFVDDLGVPRFKQELAEFISSVQGGWNPDCRYKAFTARLAKVRASLLAPA